MFVIGPGTITAMTGQEKKSEQKIKIIVNDGSGTKIVIDTLITDGHMQDSITLKDGKVIFIGHSGDEHTMKHSEKTEEFSTRSIVAKDGIVVTVEGNDEAKVKELMKEIQNKMGVNPPVSEKEEAINTGTKKSSKK